MVLFLDADCQVPRGYDQLILDAVKKKNVIGGAFEFAMERGGPVHKLAEWFNRTRYRLTQNYFGDQGIFCLKIVFDEIGGYPDQPIMEAAYFCQMLRKKGKLKLIKQPLVSSIRRFEKGGVFNVLLKDGWIWVQFLLGMDISKYAKSYWNENQKGF